MSILNESPWDRARGASPHSASAAHAPGTPLNGLSRVMGETAAGLENVTIPRLFRRAVPRHGPKDALVFRSAGERKGHHDVDGEIGDHASGLLAVGLWKGDRVGIWSPNRHEWILTRFATARIGAILVNVSPACRIAEIEYALNKVGCKALVLARSFKSSDCLSMIRKPAAEPEAHAPGRLRAARLPALESVIVTDRIRLTAADRLCIPMPLYHCFGMVMGVLGAVGKGAAMVFPGEAFEPRATLHALSEERCTAVYGVPTMFVAMLQELESESVDLGRLRTGIMAGAPCPTEVMERVTARMNLREVTICYGMTETSPVSFQSLVDERLDKRCATVGRAHPHLQAKAFHS